MNYKSILQILLILLLILTLCISIIKPKMHKVMMIYDSNYKVEPTEQVLTENKNIPTINPRIKQETPKQNLVNNVGTDNSNYQPAKIIYVKQNQTSTNPVTAREVQQPILQKRINTVSSQPKQKHMSARQELIAWNIWRSNLQNSIMSDVNLPILPNGIVFKFAFDVDKYGRISNVQTWSTTPNFTPYAIQYIAPVIRSYQGHSILNFPIGSTRITTHVTGGWKISSNERMSTPNDYHDMEKVNR